jgi:hypothetical protein
MPLTPSLSLRGEGKGEGVICKVKRGWWNQPLFYVKVRI